MSITLTHPRATRRLSFKTKGKTMTEQSHAKSCNINTIMARYEKTGLIEHMSSYEPQYGDVSEADYKKSLDLVAAVTSEFEELPAYVRAHYNGDASNYLAAIQTEEGIEDLRSIQHPADAYTKDGSPSSGESPKDVPEKPDSSGTENGDGVT